MSYPNYPQSPQQPGYQQWQGYPPPRPTNGLAIAALIFAFVFPLLGIILGHVARSQIRRTGEGGAGMALAGLIISYISCAIGLIFLFFVLLGLAVVGENVDNQKLTPTVTDTGSAEGTFYQTPRQPIDGPAAVIIRISDRRSISF